MEGERRVVACGPFAECGRERRKSHRPPTHLSKKLAKTEIVAITMQNVLVYVRVEKTIVLRAGGCKGWQYTNPHRTRIKTKHQ